jgi:hypothetical protein
MRVALWVRIAALAALALPALAAAQTPEAQNDEASVPKLDLVEDASIAGGKVAAVQGTVDTEGLRYTVGSLSVLQPVVVTLLARDDADDLTLSVFKGDWKGVRRTASTRGHGIAQLEFRTEGGMNLLVQSAAAATPFALLVWAGDELHPAMPAVLVSPEEFRKRKASAAGNASGGGAGVRDRLGGGSTNLLWIVLAALIGGAVVFIALRLLGRRKKP